MTCGYRRVSSLWSSPVILLQKKKNGDLRFCVDSRRRNNVTRKDCFPLPQIDDTIDSGWSQMVLHSQPEEQ
jgi:hypothetical protein